jgi:hypothetical protein
MPSISTTLAEIISALHSTAQTSDLIDATKLGDITYDPDEFLCSIVKPMASKTEFHRALVGDFLHQLPHHIVLCPSSVSIIVTSLYTQALGIPGNTSIESIILEYVEDFGAGQLAVIRKAHS